MVINDWIIEYERTNKSTTDSKAVVDYWTGEQGKHLCVIFETEEIKNRYNVLLNPRVKLLASSRSLSSIKTSVMPYYQIAKHISLRHQYTQMPSSLQKNLARQMKLKQQPE